MTPKPPVVQATDQTSHPTLIAHRGASARYPENTIVAYQAAIDAGAKFMELDVQLTIDRVPIVHHDVDLSRMTGTAGNITTMQSVDVLKLRAGYSEKFGDKFANNSLATLSEFAHWFSKNPHATIFVEIKSDSVNAFGTEETAKIVLAAIEPIKNHSVVISFHDGVIEATRKQSPKMPIGWVIREYNESSHQLAKKLNPQYLFCSTKRIPGDRKVWLGDWQWALYNTDTVAEAMDFYRSGFNMLETNCIVDLHASPEFSDHNATDKETNE